MPDSIAEMQRLWHEAREALANEGFPERGPLRARFNQIDTSLSARLWADACRDREEDRRKFPKAKRNQKHSGPTGLGRMLP